MLDHIDLPKFEGYHKTVFIQYNPNSKHFRTIKYRPGKLSIFDNGEEKVIPCEDMETVVHDDQWQHYIVGYHRKPGASENTKWKDWSNWEFAKWAPIQRKRIGGTKEEEEEEKNY